MNIKQAKFVISIASTQNIPDYGIPEIAVAGKSNVGKSSFINFIANQNKLAKTSAEPGRTRLLNYFDFNSGEFLLVDLPGYGFAKVNRAEKEKWGELIETYLTTSTQLINVLVLVDSRHEPTSDDKMLIDYLYAYHIPFTIIATKSDKLSKQEQQKSLKMLSSCLTVGIDNIIMTSAVKKTGKEKVLERIEHLLENADKLVGTAIESDED